MQAIGSTLAAVATKAGRRHGAQTTYWLEIIPVDTGGVQLVRHMALGPRVNRGHAATVGSWRFATAAEAQLYAASKFNMVAAMI